MHTLAVRFEDLGLPAEPALSVNGARVPAKFAASADGARTATATVPLLPGFNTIDVEGGAHALDVDYLQMDSGAAAPEGKKA
jgi:hypothetical protein